MKARERQQKLRDKRKKEGWKFIWIPPELISEIKQRIKELTTKKETKN